MTTFRFPEDVRAFGDHPAIIDAEALQRDLLSSLRRSEFSAWAAGDPPTLVTGIDAVEVDGQEVIFRGLSGRIVQVPFSTAECRVRISPPASSVWIERGEGSAEWQLSSGSRWNGKGIELARIIWDGTMASISPVFWPTTARPGNDPRARLALGKLLQLLPPQSLSRLHLKATLDRVTWTETRSILLREIELEPQCKPISMDLVRRAAASPHDADFCSNLNAALTPLHAGTFPHFLQQGQETLELLTVLRPRGEAVKKAGGIVCDFRPARQIGSKDPLLVLCMSPKGDGRPIDVEVAAGDDNRQACVSPDKSLAVVGYVPVADTYGIWCSHGPLLGAALYGARRPSERWGFQGKGIGPGEGPVIPSKAHREPHSSSPASAIRSRVHALSRLAA